MLLAVLGVVSTTARFDALHLDERLAHALAVVLAVGSLAAGCVHGLRQRPLLPVGAYMLAVLSAVWLAGDVALKQW